MLQEQELKERLKKYRGQLIATEEGTDAEIILVTTIEVLECILEIGD